MEFINKQMTEQQMATLMEGVTLFQNDFPEIINILHTKAPNAAIFVNTVYNPITPILGVYEASEILIPIINEFIIENAEELGYIVVDIYSAYKESSAVITNFNIIIGSVDIHPNAAGHTLIAETAAAKIFEYLGVEITLNDSYDAESPLYNIETEIETNAEIQTGVYTLPTNEISPSTNLYVFIAAATALIAAILVFIFIKIYKKRKINNGRFS